jgi:hypothetical protein
MDEMSADPGLPRTTLRTIRDVLRTEVLLGTTFAVLSVPVFTAFELYLQSATGYALVAMLTLVATAAAHSARGGDRITSSTDVDGVGFTDAVFVALTLAFVAAITTLVGIGGIVGYYVGVVHGLPVLAVTAAGAVPLVDAELNDLSPYLSPSVLVRVVVLSLVVTLGLLDEDDGSVAASLRDSLVSGGRWGGAIP